jgi:hypothetical protein
MLLFCHPNEGKDHDITIGNRCFQNVAQFRYLGTIRNQNLIQAEIKRRPSWLMLATIQSRTFFLLLSKNIKIKIYKSTFLPVVLYGCKTWCLTLREEHRLQVFGNRVLKILRQKRYEVTG